MMKIIIILSFFVGNILATSHLSTKLDPNEAKYLPLQTSIDCPFYVFMGEISDCTCNQNILYYYLAQYIGYSMPTGDNNYGIRAFGDSILWVQLSPYSLAQFESVANSWLHNDEAHALCTTPQIADYTQPFVDLLQYLQGNSYSNYGLFMQGETDTVVDLNRALTLASQIATYNISVYIWDHSINCDQTGLFATLTGNKPGHVFCVDPNLSALYNIVNQQLIPDFQSFGCGTLPPTMPTPAVPPTPLPVPDYCADVSSATNGTDSPVTSFPTPSSTNSSCVSIEIIFILDQSESVIPDIYNYNITQFVIDIANQFIFYDETSAENPAYARFGIIQFSDDPMITIPLGNYSRSQFSNAVYQNVFYGDGGESGVRDALLAANTEFQRHSTLRNRAIILLVNDIAMFNMAGAVDALHKLEKNVQLPMGVIVPGLWGNTQEALSHLVFLLDNNTQLAFSSLSDATTGIPNLIDSTFPCEEPPVCSALIFVEEATEVIGKDSKLLFLQLVQKLLYSINHKVYQRFGIALFGTEVYQKITLQTFEDFNKTIIDFINTVQDVNFPNGGKTYVTSMLQNLNNTVYSGVYKNYAVLFMGETEAVKDMGKAMPFAQSIGASGANVYILDQSQYTFPSALWPTLTNNAPNHIINGTAATIDSLFQVFNQTLIYDFGKFSC